MNPAVRKRNRACGVLDIDQELWMRLVSCNRVAYIFLLGHHMSGDTSKCLYRRSGVYWGFVGVAGDCASSPLASVIW